MKRHKILKFPKTRIATKDVGEIGMRKHHVAAMIELDVTESRAKIRKYKKEIHAISFTAWLVKAISISIKANEHVAAYLKGKRKLVVFDDVNISIIVEKEIEGQKVPIPLMVEKADKRSIESITKQINDARNVVLTDSDIVLQQKSQRLERMYYYLPGFIRKIVWKIMLKNPRMAFTKMGNVAITSIGMMGNINGWFIPSSVHPVCFGIGSILKKPVVIDDKVEIREMLHMTILLDHDVIDGAPMARFIKKLAKNIEGGIELEKPVHNRCN